MQFSNQFFTKFNHNQQVRNASETKVNEAQVLDNKTICFVYPNGDVVIGRVNGKSEYAV